MDLLIPILSIALFTILVLWWIHSRYARWKRPREPMPRDQRDLLEAEVGFYQSLSEEQKRKFERRVQEFLLNYRITGIETQVDQRDKLLVASSAVIPIFEFDDWRYSDLYEVLLYPRRFNLEYETDGADRRILGMVGNGYMNGVMILSKPALVHGFKNERDKKNTAIHEFVHLIDKEDGEVDGIPGRLLEKQYSVPWLDLIRQKIDQIDGGGTRINPYGGTNRAEFFAVISEYFFERPRLLKRHHHELYHKLKNIFKQDLALRNLRKKRPAVGRNSPCPCQSGKKFKHCCGQIAEG